MVKRTIKAKQLKTSVTFIEFLQSVLRMSNKSKITLNLKKINKIINLFVFSFAFLSVLSMAGLLRNLITFLPIVNRKSISICVVYHNNSIISQKSKLTKSIWMQILRRTMQVKNDNKHKWQNNWQTYWQIS